jgi:hypothetical protein
MKSVASVGLMAVTLLIAQGAPPGGAVEGTVVNSATGADIGGRRLLCQFKRRRAATDAFGYFKISGTAPGNYRASVEKHGFARQAWISVLYGWAIVPIAGGIFLENPRKYSGARMSFQAPWNPRP